jgi:hypothetical protein
MKAVIVTDRSINTHSLLQYHFTNLALLSAIIHVWLTCLPCAWGEQVGQSAPVVLGWLLLHKVSQMQTWAHMCKQLLRRRDDLNACLGQKPVHSLNLTRSEL